MIAAHDVTRYWFGRVTLPDLGAAPGAPARRPAPRAAD